MKYADLKIGRKVRLKKRGKIIGKITEVFSPEVLIDYKIAGKMYSGWFNYRTIKKVKEK